MTERSPKDAALAIEAGDLERLERLLTDSPELLSARDEDGRTLLDLAARTLTGNIAIPASPGTPAQRAAVQLILRRGADPAAGDADGWTPLHTAAMAGHADLAGDLIAAGAPLAADAHGKRGATPLAYALFYAKDHMARVLQPLHPDNLRTAAAVGVDPANGFERFFEGDELTADARAGLDFHGPTFFPAWQRTFERQEVLDEALTWAARNERPDSMAALTARGADVNANPYRGTALLWACYSDRVNAARWLLDNGADPDLRHDWGGSGHGVGAVAMHLAAQYGALGCLELLLERGADPTIADGAYGGTPLDWAEHAGATEATALLKSRSS